MDPLYRICDKLLSSPFLMYGYMLSGITAFAADFIVSYQSTYGNNYSAIF